MQGYMNAKKKQESIKEDRVCSSKVHLEECFDLF